MSSNVILPFALLALLGILTTVWRRARERAILRRWARDNHYELRQVNRRHLRRGPFQWSLGARPVFRVDLQDHHGRSARAWVRCGSYWLGLLSNRIDVRWDAAVMSRHSLEQVFE